MNFNRKALSRLLALNDEELAAMIRSVAAESGVDPSKISLTPSDIANIRAALSVASNDDLAKLAEQFGLNKK